MLCSEVNMDLLKYKYYLLIPLLLVALGLAIFLIVHFTRNTSLDADVNIEGEKFIIDHDGGADDAMAIFMAVLYEKYYNGPKVIGLTTNHGNVDEDQVFYNSQRLLHIAGRQDIPIYRGSNFSLVENVDSDFFFGYDGLGDNQHETFDSLEAQSQHAAFAFIALTKKYPGEITIITLGSLTNIALAIRLDPGFISRLGHLYVAAGHVYRENFTDPEYNAVQDVEAYHITAENANPNKVTILPFSQVETPTVTRKWREEVLGAIPTEIMKEQNSFERLSIDYRDTWILLDPIAMGAVLNQSIINSFEYSQNGIILCGDQRGVNTNNFISSEANVRVINGIQDRAYQDLLISIFSAELK